MPPDPTSTVTPATPPGRLPTNAADIGRIVPSFDSPQRFNALVIRADLRISLRLGPIESLFVNPPASELGRMERLQVLGLFYFPLNHAQALTAFRGIPAQTPPTTDPAPAFMGAWDYFKTNIMGGASDDQADAEIQKRLIEWIMDTGQLPPPADDPAAPVEGNFRKLRLPGGYTFFDSWQAPQGLNLNQDPRPAYRNSTLGTNLYTVESRFRTDNPILGKLPLIALVEKRDPDTSEWRPLADAWVYFQLVAPYNLPGFDQTRSVADQLNRPLIRDTTVGPPFPAAPVRPIAPANLAGPMKTINREENPTAGRAPAAGDPQAGNCRSDRGGLQGQGSPNAGTDVADIILSITSFPGFNTDPRATRTDVPLPPLPPFPLAVNAAAGGHHLHAVKAKTNTMGEAGVIFTPSRCGGDRYRFRAYVGPTTTTGDGTGAQAVSVDTGTFVIWRHLRVSRVVRQPIGQPAAVLMQELAIPAYAHLNTDPVNPATTPIGYLRRAYLIHPNNTIRPPLPTVDFSFLFNAGTQAHPPTAFDSFPVAWAKAFVEVELDPTAQVNPPESLSAADWQAARQQARRDARLGQFNLGTRFDLDRLMHMEAGSTVTVSDAVVHLPLRTPEAYNASLPGGTPATRQFGNGNNTVGNLQSLVMSYMLPGFLRRLTSNGFMPGITIISGGYGCSYALVRRDIVADNSGWSLEYRGGLVWAGAPFYSTAVSAPPLPTASRPPWSGYSFTSNTCHEVGHVLFRLHGPGNDPGMGAGGGAAANSHDDIATTQNESICVMSYMTCEGDFCARCLLAFRGWDISTVPNP